MKRVEKLVHENKFELDPSQDTPFLSLKCPRDMNDEGIRNWLLEELPEPKELTVLELELAKYFIESGFKWVARDRGDGLYVTRNKYLDEIDDGEYMELYGFLDLFPFVQRSDDEPTKLQDLIDNCVVYENK
jgi:hypothetical protein